MVIVQSMLEFTPLYTGHRWSHRVAEGAELVLTALVFSALDDAAAMGSQYGDACSGGGADNGRYWSYIMTVVGHILWCGASCCGIA